MSDQGIAVGAELDLTVRHYVPGGHAIGHAAGHTLFVRHGLPGEGVRVRVTEVRPRAIRADVIEVRTPSPDRVTPPCRFAGICGGCDMQHIELGAQRRIKSEVLRDALRRQAGIDLVVPVEEVPGAPDGLRWRSRVMWQFDDEGRRGFYRYRSHEIVPIDDCLIAAQDATAGEGHFSQVHRGIAPELCAAVTALAQPRAGEQWWDLYGGTGLFAEALADADATVHVVDTSRAAIETLRQGGNPRIRAHRADVARWLKGKTRVDGVVTDPPRAGLGASIIARITEADPRIVIMVSCHPVTFARDVAEFQRRNYHLVALRAFDAFPMTWHMELVAALVAQPESIH